jgi:hypothetical protein
MPSFNSHLDQVLKNLKALEYVNSKQDFWDWQVTICFYTAVHLINFHLDKLCNMHYNSHVETETAINPAKLTSPTKLDDDTYTSYMSLKNLSKRSRYLCHENKDINDTTMAYYTYEKHFSKAIYHLDKVIKYVDVKYSLKILKTKVIFNSMKLNSEVQYFKVA